MILTLIACSFSLSNAQDSVSKIAYWQHDTSWTAEIPIWIPGLRGNLSYGQIDTGAADEEEDTEFERVEGNAGLKFYFNGSLAKRYSKLWISLDAFTGKVGSTFSYIPVNRDSEIELVDIDISGPSPRLTFGYSLIHYLKNNRLQLEVIPYTGLRYVSIRLNSGLFNGSDIIDLNPNWLEPIVGLYIPLTYQRFKLELQADLGWSRTNETMALQGRCRYRLSRLIDMALGITMLDFDYAEQLNNENLEFDLRLVGPTLAICFNF